MITIDGQKMGKSLGNFITLDEFLKGEHKLLDKAYSPMTIRFFILQAHYRSPLDFSNKALQAAEKGLARLFAAMETLSKLEVSEKSSYDVADLKQKCFDAINDDLNTPVLMAHLFDGVKFINSVAAGTESITADDLNELKKLYQDFVFEITGLLNESDNTQGGENKLDEVINILLNTRLEAKKNKDFATSDRIRDQLTKAGIIIKDTKDGFEWELK
jgi:cysteinyl-tRNA synthetase